MKQQTSKLRIAAAASLLSLTLVAAPARADHGSNLVAPVITAIALGALINHQHHRHHYHGHGKRYGHYRHHRPHRYSHSYGHGGYRPHKGHDRRNHGGHKRHNQRSHW